MIGKLANVMRLGTTVAVGGSSGCTREIAALTYCSVWNISTFQSKNRLISAEPRLVMDRTCCSPGTLFTASSTGRVMVTIIWSMGITPLSTPTMIRGKSVVGKTEIGMVNARYAPTQPMTMIRNRIDFELRANHSGDVAPSPVCGGRRVSSSRTFIGASARGFAGCSVRASGFLFRRVAWLRLPFIRCRRGFHLHLGVLGQSVCAHRDHAIALFQAGEDLRFF